MRSYQEAIDQGARFYVSHSGGKDSQAMYAFVCGLVPSEQITVIHAHLGEIEWPGVRQHIRATIHHTYNECQAGKTFFEMVERRFETRPDVPSWPAPGPRQCTSDLKRDPIHTFIRRDLKSRGERLAVNCTGLRAQESKSRAKRATWSLNKKLEAPTLGRHVYDWLPIHGWTTEQVFAAIAQAGQEPFHAYADGNERLSCMFCIMGCPGDLQNAARQNPELLQKYLDLEERTGYTMFATGSLAEKLIKHQGPKQEDLF